MIKFLLIIFAIVVCISLYEAFLQDLLIGIFFLGALCLWAINSNFLRIIAIPIIVFLLYIPFHHPRTVIVNDGIEKIFQILNYLFNNAVSTDYDKSLSKNYQDYDTNIQYSANKDLINEFHNKVDVEEKKIVIVGKKMWEKNPYYKVEISKDKDVDPFALVPLPDLSDVDPFALVLPDLSIATKVLWKEANNHCNDSTLENFNDWRLPRIDELSKYYESGIKVYYKSMVFWSSTESEKEGYDYQGMSFDGKGWSISKNSSEYVLCVREL